VTILAEPGCDSVIIEQPQCGLASLPAAPAVATTVAVHRASLVKRNTTLLEDPLEVLTAAFEGASKTWTIFQAFPAEQVANSSCLVSVNPDKRTTCDIDLTPTGCNRFRLSRGSILAYNDRPAAYDTPNGSVQVDAHSAALISVESGLTRVLDLSD